MQLHWSVKKEKRKGYEKKNKKNKIQKSKETQNALLWGK